MKFTRNKALLGIFAPTAVYLFLIALAYELHRQEDDHRGLVLTVLISVGGLTLGWLAGFLGSPASDAEEKRFSKYAAAISAFVSGYVLSKVEPWITALIAVGKTTTGPVFPARLLIFIASMIIGAIGMYVFRANFTLDESKVQNPAKPVV